MASQRIVYFDLLNIAACFCVICLHCNVMVHSYVPGINWACGLVIEVVCYWAVPIFFMLSGANLMRYRDRYDTKTFFRKRFLRVLIPFLAWSLILYVLRFGIETLSPQFGVAEFFRLLMTNGIEGVYWFFFPMLALYLAMPVLSTLADNKRVLAYLVGVAFIFQAVCPPLAALAGVPWNYNLALPVAAGFVMYAVLGYLLANTELSKRTRLWIYAAGAACFLLRYGYTLAASTAQGTLVTTLFDYMYFTAAIPAVAVFIWFKYHDWQRKPNLQKYAKGIAAVSSCSFGIYLIHRIVLVEGVFNNLGIAPNSILLRTVGPFVVYFLCLGIVYLIKKIPGLKILVP